MTIESTVSDDLWHIIGRACRYYSCFLTYWTLTFHFLVRLYLLYTNAEYVNGSMSDARKARRGALQLLSLTLAILICKYS